MSTHNIFSKNSFARLMRAGDSRRFKVNIKLNRDTILSSAVTKANSGSVSFSNFHNTKIKSRNCISIKSYPENLILRSISKYLSLRYNLFPKNRDRIVKEVIETLCDSTPMYILRRDIKSFYENIPTNHTKRQLLNDSFIPCRTKNYLTSFFSTFCLSSIGIPRGAGLSTILAELSMRDYDKKVRGIKGIYKYFRYSDDILIFSYKPPEIVSAELEAKLPPGLKFNLTKSTDVIVCCTKNDQKTTKSIEYLGYKFSFSDFCGDKKPRSINVSIADRKLAKFKTRVILALKNFSKNGNFDLLYDRLRFVSSNYFAYRHGASSIKNSLYVKSGIYYNYHLCGTYKGESYAEYNCNELKALDAFYHSILFNSSSDHSGEISHLEASKVSKLRRLSFYKGYKNKMTVRFLPDRVQQIKEVWRNA
jgi:hypothetical protein